MNKKYKQLIADYLKGNLDSEGKQQVEELLAKGEIDFIDFRAIEQLYDELETIPVPEPGPGMNQRFYSMLEEEKKAANASPVNRVREFLNNFLSQLTMPRLAYAFVLLVVGGFIGAQIGSNDAELEKLSSEMRDMRQMMMVSMLEGPSATDRLKAINISTELNSSDDKAARALLFTLNNDPSVNVRVQAIEALKRWGETDYVREGLVNAISKQESPIVIIELADAMIELELRNSAGELEKLLQEKEELDFNVKRKLESSIAALS